MKKRRIITVIAVTVITVAALYFLQCLVVPKYQTGIVEGSMTAEYYNADTKHDVVMIGDCELYENISTVTLWEKYGISSYIRGSAQQLMWHSYYLLEDTLKHEKPAVAVFNVLSLKYNKPQSESYNRMTIDGMKWSSSKIDCINASMTDEEKLIEYVFPLLRYHSRITELTEDDFKYLFKRNKVTHNGYYMRVDTKPQKPFPDPMPLADYTLGEYAMSYLRKTVQLCKENGVQLVLIKAPIEYPHWYDEWDKQIEEFAKENELLYLNFIPLMEEIGLDMSVDTYDAGLHLNTAGAEKFAEYFGAWLKDNTDIPDRRNDSEYSEQWKKITEEYEKMKAHQYYELETYGELMSYGANAIK